MATLNSNALVSSPTSHNETQSTAEVENIVRHLDFAALDRLMNAAAAISNNQASLKSIWQKNIKSKNMIKNSLSESSENNRKSSRGSEEDPRSYISDEEDEDYLEEDILNEEQCSAFLASTSPDLVDNMNSSRFDSISKSFAKNFSQVDSLNEELCEDNDEFVFANKPLKSPGRRKSSSRLARQTGGGNNCATSKYTCHLCEFSCDEKPQFNAHMDKHYEHRCSRCGYGCRTKGRLNRHIREAHPDLASDLSESKSKRKKRPASVDLNIVPNKQSKLSKPDTEDVLSNSVVSDAGSDSTIIIDPNNANKIKSPEEKNFLNPSDSSTLINTAVAISNETLTDRSPSPEYEFKEAEDQDQSPSCDQLSRPPSNSDQVGVSCNNQTNITRRRRYKCKQCNHLSTSKADFWEHNKTHIKAEKMLKCPNCKFITELKHHLEYHLRIHFNSKPFKCIKCNYSCINKSMLSSHLKSHSSVYQYRCNDCAYATKYCHSLKLHLRKYNHKPDKVLNLDGSENPYPIIDVYGTRRGPRPKKGVGSLKLVKQVLEDNDHVVVNKEKVDLIVTTLSEQNPEEGDEKLFRIMRSNEEREVRVDQQLNYIIGEQLKANTGTVLPSNQVNECQNSSLIDKNEYKEATLKDTLSQAKNQNSCKALSKSFTPSQVQSTVHFVKEKIKMNQVKNIKKPDIECKDFNQANYFHNLSSNIDLDEQEKVQSPTLKQNSNQKLLNLINSEQMSDIPTALLARSLLSPSVFSSNEKETNNLFIDNYSPSQAQQLITNQLLQNQLALIAQLKANQQIVNNIDSKQESTDLLNNLSSPNNFFSQLATLNMVLNNNKFTDSSHLQDINNLWTESNLNTMYGQQSNPIMNSNFLNRALLNFSPRSQASNSAAALTNNSSSPDALTISTMDESSNINSKSLTNSMITNWHSYAASLLNNSKFQATSLLSAPSSPPDNQTSILNVGTTNSLTRSKATDQLDIKNVTNMKQPHSSLQQKAILSSQNDLGLVLNSIGQVFSSSPNLCPTSNTNNQSSELDLSTILGYSMLAMRMQQQFANNSSSQQKKIKESF